MLDVINTLFKTLYIKIPAEILDLAFRSEVRDSNRSLDALIKEKVIVDIVLMNTNLYTGKISKITLQEEWLKDVNTQENYIAITGDYSIYDIPPEARENRDIVHTIDVSYPTMAAFSAHFPLQNLDGRSVASSASESLMSMTRTPGVYTPAVQLTGNNIIRLEPPMATHIDWILTCFLAIDQNFNNISPNMIKPLSQMTEYACKAYIYNKLKIRLNQGMLVGGQTLESIKSIVDGYENAGEMFDEAVLKMRGASLFQSNQLIHFLSDIL